MFRTKPNSRFIFCTLTLILLLSLFTSIIASDLSTNENDDDDDSEGIEELLAFDEEVEREEQEGGSGLRSSEAEVLTKAQRIVLELNGENTKKVIDDNEFVLVLGYAPWCPRSAELMPQFSEAATSLKEVGSPLLMAKLDAERYPKAALLLEIKGFPTLLLFVNGTSQAYTGGFTAEEIVIWARKKTGVPVIRISSVTEAEIGVKSLVVHNFYVGKGTDSTGVPTKMLTVNGSLKLSVYNPATLFGIHVSSGPINLVYSKIAVATGQLKKYYQPRKSRRNVHVNLEGVKVPLYGAGSGLVVSQNGRTVVPLTLNLEIRSRGNGVGKLVRTKHRKLISCPLTIDSLSTKAIKFKKNSCTYQ